MRSLFISDTVPFPPNTGRNQRTFHLLRAVASVSDTILVCYLRSEAERVHLEALKGVCREIHAISPDQWAGGRPPNPNRFRNRMAAIISYCHPTKPFVFQWYETKEGKKLVERLCSQFEFDVVWASKLFSLNLLPASLHARILVDHDEFEYSKLQGSLRHTSVNRLTPFLMLDYLKLSRTERRLTRHPYEFVVSSSIDAQKFGHTAKVWLVPNGTELPPLRQSTRASLVAPSFFFIGLMSYPPNVDAVKWFASEIFPKIRERLPESRFYIAGHHPHPSVLKLHNGESTFVLGSVSDPGDYLTAAAAAVVPIRFGGGTRLKVLEAMAHRAPVVATSVGASGLDLISGKHFLCADSPSAFAEACEKVVRDPVLRASLTARAYDLVEKKYQWRYIERQVAEIIQRENRARPNLEKTDAASSKEEAILRDGTSHTPSRPKSSAG